MNTSSYLISCLRMEWLKIKGTLVIWLAILAPAFVVVVAFIAGYADGTKFYRNGINPWINFSEHILAGWSLFIFPLYVSLLSALYAGIEHQNRAWGYLYSLPVSKSSIYLSKLIMMSALVALSHFALVVFECCAGTFMAYLKPEYGFANFSMPAFMPTAIIHLYICGLGMIVIQLLISIWYSNFIVPAGFGLFATLASAIARSFEISHFSPYLWPFAFLNNTLQISHWHYSIQQWSIVLYISGAAISLFILGRRSTFS